MKTFNIILLLSALLTPISLALPDDFGKPYSNPYANPYGGSPFNTFPDGSSRPLNPGPDGRWNDDEYTSRQQLQQQQQHRQSEPSYELPTAPVTKDFNVWKDGKPTLCTATKQDVYCY